MLIINITQYNTHVAKANKKGLHTFFDCCFQFTSRGSMAAFSRIRVISFIITAEGGGRNSTCYDVLKIEGFTGNTCTLGLLGLCSHTPTLAAHRSNSEGQHSCKIIYLNKKKNRKREKKGRKGKGRKK